MERPRGGNQRSVAVLVVRGDGSAKIYAGGLGLGTVVGTGAVETVARHVLMEGSCRRGRLGNLVRVRVRV